MKNILNYFDDLIWMMYPVLCAACNKPLFKGEKCVCTRCLYHLPRTGFHSERDNNVIRHFWGKAKIEMATAGFFFGKGQRMQRLIHQLKYKGRQDVGEFLGAVVGRELSKSDFSNIDLIVPVPLHKSRLKFRGYNQSDCIASGLSTGMDRPFSSTAIVRNEATSTQTKKHRYERFKNVDRIFSIPDEQVITGKHILLVDDVITTGSTLVSCAESILSVKGTMVSIAALACA